MKICKIIIKDFHQFKDFELDLTHPETGEPLEKVCFIGSNGTGKTKLLNTINHFFSAQTVNDVPLTHFKLQDETLPRNIWVVFTQENKVFFDENIKNYKGWEEEINTIIKKTDLEFQYTLTSSSSLSDYVIGDAINHINPTLAIFCPAELEKTIEFLDVPQTNLNDSLKLFEQFPSNHIVSNETITDFWKTLIYHLKKRDNDFLEFQNLEENQNRTVREVREEFDSKHPKILDSLAKLWDEILGKAGLEFDAAGASNPIQLTDNLKAYIKLKSTGERINYNDLSTGIRNFIFKVGHIYSLYFNRNVESGFLLVDEPENSLFPDFLYDLVDIYLRITHNTQIFMATHNPIIAAQFEPYERFILEFDDQGHVQARRGTVPVGDDPNDILSKDFGVRSLLGKEGVKKWERYIELRTLIKLTEDREEKSRLLDEFMRIGNEYNFANAVS